MKKFFILMIVLIAIIVSIFNSKNVYKFHIRFYYKVIKKSDYQTLLFDVRRKFKEIKKGDSRSYNKLRDYIEELLLVYPGDQEFSQLLGLTYIRLGYSKKGAQVIITSRIDRNMPTLIVDEVVKALFEEKSYSDIVYFIDNNKFKPNQTILYHYGVSLYMTRKYKEAIENLFKSNRMGRRDFRIYYYIGLSYYSQKDYNNALVYLKKSYNLNYRDKSVSRALVETYRMLNRFKDAEKIVRRSRR